MHIYGITFLMLLHMYSFSFEKRISIFAGPGGGHPAVTQSLIKGLQKLNISFDYNNYTNPSNIVVVLAHIDDLKRAIHLKRQGKIKILLAGPNLMVRSNEFDGILGLPEIDICIVPSDWVAIAYEEDIPRLKGRIATWFAGIDEEYWKPTMVQKKNVLVYWKTEPKSFCERVEQILKERGFMPVRIQYGHYHKEQFKYCLDQSLFAVFISKSESQGIALAEAWAMNVPTLVFDPGQLTIQGKQYTIVSSCPLLTEMTGKTWKNFEEFTALLDRQSINSFAPRLWVINHLTYGASANRFIEIIKTVLNY